MYKLYCFLVVLGVCCGCQDPPRQPVVEAKHVPVLQPLDGGDIDWHVWADRDSARMVNKPILLFLYNQRSFWCRDMAARCFTDRELVQEIERITYPIWVDVDKHPDVFERFSLGGVPSVAFLKPDASWIAGGTYLDPEDLANLVRRVSFPFVNPKRMDALEEQRTELLRRARLFDEAHPRPRISPSENLHSQILDSLANAVDHGLDVGAEGALALFEARQSMDGMTMWLRRRRDGDGAFFLYAHTTDGRVVDKEKNLGQNASMLAALALAGQKNDDIGEAGLALGDVLLTAFAQNALFCAGFAGFETAHGISRDHSVYVGWNALTISGLVSLFKTTEIERFQEAAFKTIDAVMQQSARSDGFFHHALDQETTLLLEDQAFMARAALDVYDISGQAKYLQVARRLADGMLLHFADDSGMLRDRKEPTNPVYPVEDRWVPSANGVAAQVFVRLSRIETQKKYQEAAHRILTASLGPNIDEASSLGALCRALGMYLDDVSEQR